MLAHLPPDEQRLTLALAAARLKLQRRVEDERPTGKPWREVARPDQIQPADYRTWFVRGGRGSGKTRTGAETLRELIDAQPGDYGVVSPTLGACKEQDIEGPSGLLAAYGTTVAEIRRGESRHVLSYNQTYLILRLRNGSIIYGDGADDGAPTIQGKNLRGLWADEVALWKKWKMAWEESIRYAVRISPAKIIATGTPKRGHPLVKLLMADASVAKTLLRTRDNAANLDPSLLEELYSKYGGTVLGRQELEGEILDDVPGALWTRDLIERGRLIQAPELVRIIVAVDPSATSTESADECGIVVVGKGKDQHGYVLEDDSLRDTPHNWARAAVVAYHKHKADSIIAEGNNGGEMVAEVIRAVDPTVPVRIVHATQGKHTRAEPISTLYAQGVVHHVGAFEALEDQMASWNPDTDKSPDRMDALVWGISELMVSGAPLSGYYRSEIERLRAAREKAKETAA
jgi:predicted phage terminase large subunit-like protein